MTNQVTLNIEPFFFKKKEWRLEPGALEPIPETWCDLRQGQYKILGLPSSYLALFCCPNCRKMRAIDRRVHKVDPFGKVSTKRGNALACTDGCSFIRITYLDRWSKKPLYCACIERLTPNGYVPIKRYCHATTEQEARTQLIIEPHDRIIGVAPVIGYYSEDKDEKICSVD